MSNGVNERSSAEMQLCSAYNSARSNNTSLSVQSVANFISKGLSFSHNEADAVTNYLCEKNASTKDIAALRTLYSDTTNFPALKVVVDGYDACMKLNNAIVGVDFQPVQEGVGGILVDIQNKLTTDLNVVAPKVVSTDPVFAKAVAATCQGPIGKTYVVPPNKHTSILCTRQIHSSPPYPQYLGKQLYAQGFEISVPTQQAGTILAPVPELPVVPVIGTTASSAESLHIVLRPANQNPTQTNIWQCFIQSDSTAPAVGSIDTTGNLSAAINALMVTSMPAATGQNGVRVQIHFAATQSTGSVSVNLIQPHATFHQPTIGDGASLGCSST